MTALNEILIDSAGKQWSIAIGGSSAQADEVAALLSAITCCLATDEDVQIPAHVAEWEWHSSALLQAQRVVPDRIPLRPSWGNIERLRRSGRGGGGIVGM